MCRMHLLVLNAICGRTALRSLPDADLFLDQRYDLPAFPDDFQELSPNIQPITYLLNDLTIPIVLHPIGIGLLNRVLWRTGGVILWRE